MDAIKTLTLDIETYSGADLTKTGVYRYAEDPAFEILLLSYAVNHGDVVTIDIAHGQRIPGDITSAIEDPAVEKHAFNAAFERICLSRHLSYPTGEYLDPEGWRCDMVWAAYLGLPLSLSDAARVTNVEKKKLAEGKDLIRYFSKPCIPTKSNCGRTRNLPGHDPEKWERFKAYNVRDVEAEMAIQAKLAKFPVPDEEWRNYILDQQINDRGIRLDMNLVEAAIRCDERSKHELSRLMREITALDNPNSVAQMKAWLASNGLETGTLGKNAVKELLKTAPGDLGRALALRQDLAKSSVRKYTAMQNAVCADGRARGLLQFYGASRTGRFAGRLIQIQNLPQNHLPDLAQARSLVKSGGYDALEPLYDSVPSVLSELIRTAFVPNPGTKFIVADFNAIEARVIAWLAGENWRNEVFASHGKIYEASASQMFHVPIEEITKGHPLRQKGKIAELALGYGGGAGALKAMGALEMGIAEDELQPLVNAWRKANPNIVRLWWDVDRAVKTAVCDKTSADTHGIHISFQSGLLFIRLPSGRQLSYPKPRIGQNRFGGESVTYEGAGQTKKWERIESYGPKFVENIVQAISRDILCHAIVRMASAGLSIVTHVHDEVVMEASPGVSTEAVCALMCDAPPWAKGLLLRAEGFEAGFYKKD